MHCAKNMRFTALIVGALFQNLFLLVYVSRKQCREVLEQGFQRNCDITLPALPSPGYSPVGCLSENKERSPGKVAAKRGFNRGLPYKVDKPGVAAYQGRVCSVNQSPRIVIHTIRPWPCRNNFTNISCCPFLHSGQGIKGCI